MCAQSRSVAVDIPDNRTLLRFRVLKRPRRLPRRPRPPTAMLCSSSADCADWTPLRFFKVATGSESSGDEFGVLTDDPRARADSRLQPTPAAAPTDQVFHLVLSRLVCHQGSSSLRVGSPPGFFYCGNGCACVLEDAVEQAVFVKASSFCRPLGLG